MSEKKKVSLFYLRPHEMTLTELKRAKKESMGVIRSSIRTIKSQEERIKAIEREIRNKEISLVQ